jgi:hypothetical protein
MLARISRTTFFGVRGTFGDRGSQTGGGSCFVCTFSFSRLVIGMLAALTRGFDCFAITCALFWAAIAVSIVSAVLFTSEGGAGGVMPCAREEDEPIKLVGPKTANSSQNSGLNRIYLVATHS